MKNLIIGGAGFIGTNATEYFVRKGEEVVVFDNLSRRGCTANLDFLKTAYPEKVKFVYLDIRDSNDVLEKFSPHLKDSKLVLHLAAQVAVTTSVTNPREDFKINAEGTFNLLEALRKHNITTGENPSFIYASTNKVYGKMDHLPIVKKETQYDYKSLPKGISEETPLDFYSPYGCSKGTGDQYVRDYARIYGLDTVVARQSCIYGPHQFGVEDQGWLAWFAICNALDKQTTIYGDGKQVRDALFVKDLVRAYDMIAENIPSTRGQVYNLGGGVANKLSVLDLVSKIENISRKKMNPIFGDWRPGDQKVCIMDISKAKRDFGWEPQVNLDEGIVIMYNWISHHDHQIKSFLGI